MVVLGVYLIFANALALPYHLSTSSNWTLCRETKRQVFGLFAVSAKKTVILPVSPSAVLKKWRQSKIKPSKKLSRKERKE